MECDEISNLTENENEKANYIFDVAKEKFSDVDITVTKWQIVLKGNNYERIIECKQWFELEIGRKQPSGRRSKINFAGNEATTKQHKYITFEKIDVIVVEGDLLHFGEEIDCYVNITNTKLDNCSQISNMLKEAGGKPYERACDAVRAEASQLRTTDCVITDAGNLRAKCVIHAFCPNKADYNSSTKMENDIFSTVENCFQMAKKNKLQTIAFPLICTGHCQLDITVCSQQYAYAILEFSRLRKNRFVVDKVYFIDKDKSKVNSVNKIFKEILPSKEMQLLEVPKDDYNDYSASATAGSNGKIGNLDHVSVDDDGEVDGKGPLPYSRQSQIEAAAGTLLREEEQSIESEDFELDRCSNDDGYENPITRSENPENASHRKQHGYEKFKFRKNIGKYDIVFEQGDIRKATTVAIVCPDNIEEERGGLLAAAIKCTFRRSFDPNKLKKLQKNAVATTEHSNKLGEVQYLFHVRTPIWKEHCKENELRDTLKGAMERIFDKLKRHKKRNIRDIAIPLMGISSVENSDVVSKCCKWQIENLVEILQSREEIPNLREVHLINRCIKTSNTLLTEMKVFLAENPTSTSRR